MVRVACLKCKSKLSIPDDKATNPRLKLKCPRCGLVFPLGKAERLELAELLGQDHSAMKQLTAHAEVGRLLRERFGVPAENITALMGCTFNAF